MIREWRGPVDSLSGPTFSQRIYFLPVARGAPGVLSAKIDRTFEARPGVLSHAGVLSHEGRVSFLLVGCFAAFVKARENRAFFLGRCHKKLGEVPFV